MRLPRSLLEESMSLKRTCRSWESKRILILRRPLRKWKRKKVFHLDKFRISPMQQP